MSFFVKSEIVSDGLKFLRKMGLEFFWLTLSFFGKRTKKEPVKRVKFTQGFYHKLEVFSSKLNDPGNPFVGVLQKSVKKQAWPNGC